MTKGLLLDFDGTLADSISVLKEVHRAFLAPFGVTVDDSDFELINGPPLPRIIELLKTTYNLHDSLNVLEDRYAAMIDSSRSCAKPAPGAADLLKLAQQEGWKIAIVSSSKRADVMEWLEQNKFAGWIDAIVGGDQVARGKPDPEPYRLGIAQLECSAALSFAVEDSRAGARSAVSAGLATFAIAPQADRTNWPDTVRFITALDQIRPWLRS